MKSRCCNITYLIILIINAAALGLLWGCGGPQKSTAGFDSRSDETAAGQVRIYKTEYRLKYPDMKIAKTVKNRITNAFDYSGMWFFGKGKNKSTKKDYELKVDYYSGRFVFFGDKKKSDAAAKIIKRTAGRLLRLDDLYGPESVATVEVFAENVRKITKNVFTREKIGFLGEREIDLISDDLADFVKKYTKDDVPKEIRIRILDGLGIYLHTYFHAANLESQKQGYTKFNNIYNTLKVKLWEVIATEPLTEEEKRTFAMQKKWVYDQAGKMNEPSELKRAVYMDRLDSAFADVLSGFCMQPMKERVFKEYQDEIRRAKDLSSVTGEGSAWAGIIAMDQYRSLFNVERRRWEFPFGTVDGLNYSSGRINMSFKSEKRIIENVNHNS